MHNAKLFTKNLIYSFYSSYLDNACKNILSFLNLKNKEVLDLKIKDVEPCIEVLNVI
jgi:hypothetical protein